MKKRNRGKISENKEKTRKIEVERKKIEKMEENKKLKWLEKEPQKKGKK